MYTHNFRKNIYLQMEGLQTSRFFPSEENKIMGEYMNL